MSLRLTAIVRHLGRVGCRGQSAARSGNRIAAERSLSVLPAWPSLRTTARKAATSQLVAGLGRSSVRVAPSAPHAYRRAIGARRIMRGREGAVTRLLGGGSGVEPGARRRRRVPDRGVRKGQGPDGCIRDLPAACRTCRSVGCLGPNRDRAASWHTGPGREQVGFLVHLQRVGRERRRGANCEPHCKSAPHRSPPELSEFRHLRC